MRGTGPMSIEYNGAGESSRTRQPEGEGSREAGEESLGMRVGEAGGGLEGGVGGAFEVRLNAADSTLCKSGDDRE